MRVLRVLIFFTLLGIGAAQVALPNPIHAQSPTTLQEYRRAIDQTLLLVKQASALPVNERTTLLEQARTTLEPIHAVQLSAGVESTVDNSALLALIRDTSKTDAAITRLTALRTALAQDPPTVSPQDLDALHTIFNNPPFVVGAADAWWQTLLQRIFEFLSRLLNNTAQGVFDSRDLLVVLGVIVVVVVAIYFVKNLRYNLVSDQDLGAMLDETEVRTPAEAFDNAQKFITAGDYRNAVRQLYLATLLILDQRGKIKYDPTLTNRQVLRQASNDPRTAAALQPIVETFDRVWYGFEPLSQSEFDAYRQRVEQVRE